MLAFDVQVDCGWDNVYYFKDLEEYEPSEYNEEYKEWLLSEFGIECEEDEEDEDGLVNCGIAERAFETIDKDFQKWFKPFYPNE